MTTLTRALPAPRVRSAAPVVAAPPARVVFYEGQRIYFSPIEPEDEYQFAILREEWERRQQR